MESNYQISTSDSNTKSEANGQNNVGVQEVTFASVLANEEQVPQNIAVETAIPAEGIVDNNDIVSSPPAVQVETTKIPVKDDLDTNITEEEKIASDDDNLINEELSDDENTDNMADVDETIASAIEPTSAEIEMEIDANNDAEVESGHIQGETIPPEEGAVIVANDSQVVLITANGHQIVDEALNTAIIEALPYEIYYNDKVVEVPSLISKIEFGISSRNLRAIADIGGSLVDELSFVVTRYGMSARFMDPSHIALVDMQIPAEVFEGFVTDGQEGKFAINLSELSKRLKKFDKDESLRVVVDLIANEMKIASEAFSTSIRLYEASESSTPLPKLNFTALVRVDGENFAKFLKQVETTSEHVTLSHDADNWLLTGRGDMGEVEVKIPRKGSSTIKGTDLKEEAKATFSLAYLNKFVSAVVKNYGGKKSSTEFIIQYAKNMPVRFRTTLQTTFGRYVGRVDFYLAPRVQD